MSLNTKTKLVSQIQSKFEGGSSFTLNWDYVLKEGAQAMIGNISPKKLTFTTAIYGGFVDDNTVYYCPSGVGAPIGIFDKLRRLKYSYIAPNIFEEKIAKSSSELIFTIQTINGIDFILINGSKATGNLIVNEMDDSSEITAGNVTVSSNTYDYISGGSSLQGTFTDTLTDIGATFDTAQDITDFLFGVGIIRAKLTNTKNIASIKLILKTDDSNYWTVTATTALDYLVTDWNIIRVPLTDRVPTGTPVATNITKWLLKITMNTGQSQTIILDQIALCSSALYNFKFTSNEIFLDATTGERKNITSNESDLINLDDQEYEIFKYECCRIVLQETTNEKTKSIESEKFDTELSRKYSLYFAKNPTNELPISYNQSPEISMSPAMDNYNSLDDNLFI